mmetsp:Transcript_28014/g.56427  ORF Transcript_28014/g.56427 Transcript_28014/m.56427 type:complete len:139 (-) Transcript_28014:19-435(-)
MEFGDWFFWDHGFLFGAGPERGGHFIQPCTVSVFRSRFSCWRHTTWCFVEKKNYVGLGNEDDDRSGDEEGIGEYQDPGHSAGAARSRLSGNTNLQNSNDLREPMLQGGQQEEQQAVQDRAEEGRGGVAVDAGAWRRMG